MNLTPEQEGLLIEQNMPKIYRAVDNFTSRHSSSTAKVPYEDFVQEVIIAFLLYIRKCETMDDANRFPWFSAMGAMRDLVMVYQPMKGTKDRSSGRFSNIIHNMPVTISLDTIQAKTGLEIDGMSKHWVEDKETQIDFDDFMSQQPENIRRIASMRVYGMTLKEIGEQCGVQKNAIWNKLCRLSNAYKKYTEGSCDDE